jgi:acyl-CoA thioesterase
MSDQEFTEISEEHRAIAHQVFESIPFVKLLGMKLTELQPGAATLTMAMREELEQPSRLMHGGAIASLIDTATAFAVATTFEKGDNAATVDMTVHYMRPVTEGTVRCEAKLLRAGKRLLTVSAEVFNEQGKLTASALTTYSKI